MFFYNKDGTYVTKVYRKETKIPAHWSLEIPKGYKRNIIKVNSIALKRFPPTSKKTLNSFGINS